MPTREQLEFERGKALRRLITESGVSAKGEIPADHVAALDAVHELGQAKKVADAHANSKAPPSLTQTNQQA